MANSNKLAEVCALLAEEREQFRPILSAATQENKATGERHWPLTLLATILDLPVGSVTSNALNRAKVAASKAEMPLGEHFVDGTVFDEPGEVFLSKYAAYLFVVNCDPQLGKVGLAQVFFALQLDRQRLEDEKRLKTRLDVATEQHKLHGVAKERGVSDFQKFNGMGVQGLYGGLTVAKIKQLKGLSDSANHLDFAGSEELAANLFRITQTRAALARQSVKSEPLACSTHKKVAEGVREAILKAGNTPPERLPAAATKIDALASATKRKILAEKK